jgi:hypothetical protein
VSRPSSSTSRLKYSGSCPFHACFEGYQGIGIASSPLSKRSFAFLKSGRPGVTLFSRL